MPLGEQDVPSRVQAPTLSAGQSWTSSLPQGTWLPGSCTKEALLVFGHQRCREAKG